MDTRRGLDNPRSQTFSQEKKPQFSPLLRKTQLQKDRETFFDGATPKDAFSFWVVKNWPTKILGKIDMTAIGILSELRSELGLTEQNLPQVTDKKEAQRQMQLKIVELMKKGSRVRLLEEEAAKQFIRDALTLPAGEFQKKFVSDLGDFVKKKFRMAKKPTNLSQLRTFLAQQETHSYEFFREFFIQNEASNALEFGRQLAKQEHKNKRNERKQEETQLHFIRLLSSDFSKDLSIPKDLLSKRAPESWQKGMEQFYDKDGKPKDSFSYWIVSGWESMFGQDSFDPVAIGFLSSLRNELGLTDGKLPAQENTIQNREKVAEIFKRIKPIVETAEKAFPSLYSFVRDPDRPAFEVGALLAEQLRENFRRKYLEKPQQFEERQRAKMQAFEQIMHGEYPYQRTEVDERAYRAVYKISHRLFKKKEPYLQESEEVFIDRADKLSQELYRRRFSLFNGVKQLLSSPESESLFKTGGKKGMKNTLVGLGVGLVAGRIPGLVSHFTESPLERVTQVEAAGAGFLLGKSRSSLKEIRWRQVGKAVLRGTTSAGLIAVTDYALKYFGLVPDMGIWWHLPAQLTIGKLLVGNVFGALGLNVSSEWAVNAILNKKGLVDEFTRYLYERKKDPKKAAALLEKEMKKKKNTGRWGLIAMLIEGKQINSLDLREASNTIKEIEESHMVLMLTNPHRYRKRVVFSDQGVRQEIDNETMLEEIQLIEQDIHYHALLHLKGVKQQEIFDILEGKLRRGKKLPPLDQRLRKQVRLNTLGRWIVTPAVNTGLILGYNLPWVKEQFNHLGDLVFGEIKSGPPQLQVSIPRFNEANSLLFTVNERTPYPNRILELGRRIDELTSVLTVYQDPHVDAVTKSALLSQYTLTPEDVNNLERLMQENGLAIEDLRVIMRMTMAAGSGEDRLVTRLSSLLSSTRHNDMKALISALSSYDTNVGHLKPELAHLVKDQHIADDLYGYTDIQGKPLLGKLGIDVNTLQFQLEFLTGLTAEQKQRILVDVHQFLFDGKHLIIKDPRNPFVAEFVQGISAFQTEKSVFILQQMERVLNSNPADLKLSSASGNTLPLFLDHAYSAYLRNNLTYDPATFYQTITEKDEYFQNVLSLAVRSGVSEADAKKYIGLAASGDVQAFNLLQGKISTQFPGDAHFLFSSQSGLEDTPVQQIFGLAISNDPKNEVTSASLLTGVRLFSGNLNLVSSVNAHPGVNPELIDLAQMPTSLPEVSMARLLNAEVPLDTELQKIFNQYPVYFMKEGLIVGQMRSSLQASRKNYPDDVLAFVRNTEGPFKNDGVRYLIELFGRNALTLVDKNRIRTGVSDPATQLIEMMGGGPPGQPLLNPSQAQHLFYHPDQYNLDYLTKLIVAVASGKMPHGMDQLLASPDIEAKAATPLRPIDQWMEAFGLSKLGKTEIDLLSFKLESYLASRRLISAYGEDEVLKSYLNYVPLGNTKEGVPIYGFEAASEYYYGKSVDQLTQGQKLILVGLIQQPGGYSPVQQGVLNPEGITRNRALAVVNLLLNEKHLITQPEAERMKGEIAASRFTNIIPTQWQNHIPEGGYQALSLLQRTGASTTPTMVPTQTVFVQQAGFFVVNLSQPPVRDATLPHLVNGALPEISLTKQPEVNSYFSHLFDSSTVSADPTTHVETVALGPGSPIPQVPIPDFEQAVKNADGSWGIVHNKGFAMIAADEHGNILGGYDETNLLSNVPVPPGSTIKPFIAAFLATHGYDLNKTLVPNAPGQYALNGAVLQYPISNPYSGSLTTGLNGVQSITLADALAISSNVPFEAAMQKYLYNHPGGVEAGWIEFQDFLGKFGLRLVDIYGNELKTPTSLAAIGSDAYVPGLKNLSVGYAILSSPELWLNSSNGKDRLIIDAAHQVTAILADDQLKQQGVPGQFMNDTGRQLLSSNCDGMACFGKTGTVGGVINGREVTNYVLTAFVVDQGNGKKVVTVGIMAGQTVDLTKLTLNGEPSAYQDNLQTSIPGYQTYGSQMVAPIVRDFSTKIAHSQIPIATTESGGGIVETVAGELGAASVPKELSESSLYMVSNANFMLAIIKDVYTLRNSGTSDEGIIKYVSDYLRSQNINPDQVIDQNQKITLLTAIQDFVQNGANKPKIQCVGGAKLLDAIAAARSPYVKWLDWKGDAEDYMYGLFGTKETFSNDGGVIRKIVRGIDEMYPGDYFVVKNPWTGETGHMGIVTERGINADGFLYVKIFDINRDSDGQPDLITITEKDDMFKLIAYVPPWYKNDLSSQTQVGIIRTYESNDLIRQVKGN